MKKTFLITALALLTVTAFGQTFGRVNTTELVQLAPEADDARTKLQAKSKDAQETYQDMVDEFNKKLDAYQKGAANFSDAVKATKEKELNEINQRVQEFGTNVQQELAQSEQVLFQPIYEKATNVVKELAKKYGLTIVFEEGSFPYYDTDAVKDLTPEARKGMGIKEGRTLESLQAELQAQQAK